MEVDVQDKLCGKRVARTAPGTSLRSRSVIELRTIAANLLKGTGTAKEIRARINVTRPNLCALIYSLTTVEDDTDPNNTLGFYSYHSNSCYIDTMLFTLFHQRNIPFVQDIFETKSTKTRKIQKELMRIYKRIHRKRPTQKKLMCKKLRKMFQGASKKTTDASSTSLGENNYEWTYKQQEPYDVIQFLSTYFNLPNNIPVRFQTKTDVRTEYNNFVAVLIGAYELNPTGTKLSDFIPSKVEEFEANGVSYRNVSTIQYTKAFMVHVNRKVSPTKKSTMPLKPTKYVTLRSDGTKKRLYCTAIILHEGSAMGGHYTCVFRHTNGMWYLYDNMDHDRQYRLIGKWKALLNWRRSRVLSLSTDLMYNEI
jgi:hypothetical protein